MHAKLSERVTDTNEGELCGACHTHVNARDWAHELDAVDAPNNANEHLLGFIAYEQDTLLDERIAGQHRRFAKSKCFQKTEMPKCKQCHDPHASGMHSVRTNTVCLECHQSKIICPRQNTMAADTLCTIATLARSVNSNAAQN